MLAVRCARLRAYDSSDGCLVKIKASQGGRNTKIVSVTSLCWNLTMWKGPGFRTYHLRLKRLHLLRPPRKTHFNSFIVAGNCWGGQRAHLTANICGLNGLRPKPCYQHRKLEGVPVKKHKPGIALPPRRTHLNHLFLPLWTNHLGLFVPF